MSFKEMIKEARCDCCGQRLTLVWHFGYNTQPKRDYRVCLKCFFENAQEILYGWMDYKVDRNIDNLSLKNVKEQEVKNGNV